jgi:hypothetical protein
LRIVIASLLVISACLAHGQDRLGMVSSNYNPSQSLYLNPSSIVDSKVFFDIHLAGAQAFAHNNLAFMPGDEFSLMQTIRNPEITPEPKYNLNRAPFRAHGRGNVFGPALTYSLGLNAIGLFTGVRVVADARRVPRHLGVYAVNGFQFADQMGQAFEVDKAGAGGLAYGEVGLAYARVIHNLRENFVSAGISVKRLIGLGGMGLNVRNWDYMVVDSLNLNTFDIDGRYGIATGGFNSGGGWGVDLGFTFKKMERDVSNYVPHSPRQNCTRIDYRWKLGFSVIDIGRIRFREEAFSGGLRIRETVNWEDYSAVNPQGAQEITDLLVEEFTEPGPDRSRTNEARILLPTALSAQFDYHIYRKFYVNSVWTHGLPRNHNLGPQHLHQFGVIPRYESRFFDFGMPVVLHNYRSLGAGAYFRFWFLVIGSDNLLWLMPHKDVSTADLYVHLKWQFFRNWACIGSGGGGSSGTGNNRWKGRGARPCPTW